LRTRPVPVVGNASEGLRWEHHAARQEFTIQAQAPALFLFGTASAERYHFQVSLTGLLETGARVILGYRPCSEEDIRARYLYCGALPGGRFGVGQGRVVCTPRGTTLVDDPEPWASESILDRSEEEQLQVGILRLGGGRRGFRQI